MGALGYLFYHGNNTEARIQSDGFLFRKDADSEANCGAAKCAWEKRRGGGANSHFQFISVPGERGLD